MDTLPRGEELWQPYLLPLLPEPKPSALPLFILFTCLYLHKLTWAAVVDLP